MKRIRIDIEFDEDEKTITQVVTLDGQQVPVQASIVFSGAFGGYLMPPIPLSLQASVRLVKELQQLASRVVESIEQTFKQEQ